MSVSIRLARAGSKKRPFYRIVAAEKSFPRDGRFIEQLGFYDPRRKVFEMKRDRYLHWVGVGAQPTDTMRTLAKKFKTPDSADSAKSAKSAKSAEAKTA